MDKNSFLIYLDYKEHFELLSDEQLGKLLRAIMEYEETGTVPALEGMEKMAFSFIKAQLDRDREKYENKCEKNKLNGAKGGRPKKAEGNNNNPENPTVFSETELNQSKPKKADNDNDTDNDIKENNKRKKYGEFENVKLTDEEYEKIKTMFPNDYSERIQKLDDYIQSKGTKYKDFVATLRNWARKEGYKFPTTQQKSEKVENVEIDIDNLTQEEYGDIVRGKVTYEEIMKRKGVQNE